MTATLTPYRSTLAPGRDGFAQTVRAEWTKLRTVRGWAVAAFVAAAIMVLLGWLTGAGSHSSYQATPGGPDIIGHPYVPLGPGGGPVTDSLTFVHQTLTGDGSLTARVGPLTSLETSPNTGTRPADPSPWAKAGLIIRASTDQGSAYAAIMITGGHGVRMQANFTQDRPGPATASWLRLSRTGDTVTGYSSTDGSTWTTVGTVRLRGLPRAVPAGLFATSPGAEHTEQHFGGGGSITGMALIVSATFDGIGRQGGWAAGAWQGDVIGADPGRPRANDYVGYHESGGTVTVSGDGDLAPSSEGTGIERVLAGTFGALTVVAVVAVLFVTTEYRRGMIRTTFIASTSRVRVLLAKALVVGGATFVTGVAGAGAALAIGVSTLRDNGNFVIPVSWATEARVVVGTGALLAVAAVCAVGLGAILRRSAAAVAAVVVVVVLPYILATAAVLPAGPSQWLLRLAPAAGFALQSTMVSYPQVDHAYIPAFGYFPLGPWAGFAVLCGYAAAALALAGYLLRRRDA